MDFMLVAGGLLKAVLPIVAKTITEAAKNKLSPTELQKALEAGLQESTALDIAQKVQNPVFYRCGDKQTDTFLARFLEHSGVQAELQKPLQDKGTPDVAMLVTVAKQVVAAHTIPIQESHLNDWLTQFADAYFRKTSEFLRFQVAKQDYLEQVANWFDDVKFAGVAVPGQDIEKAETIAQIFVMPDVVEEARSSFSRLEGDAVVVADWLAQSISSVSEATSTKSRSDSTTRQLHLREEQRFRSQLDRTGRKLSAQRLLNQQQRKLVLLGAPGSGKTTLLSYFAVILARGEAEALGLKEGDDRLPILIRVRDWERHSNPSLLGFAYHFAQERMQGKPLPTGFFEYWLERGQAIVLLDGLDEVADEGKRYEVVRRIENFLGQYPQNDAIVTSRPAGYRRDFFRTEEFPHYELQPFDDAKVEEFINRWYDSRVSDAEEAKRRKASLRKALDDNDRIKLLARNPLLLTIVALIHRYQAMLPRERFRLYDKAVETLLLSWDSNKDLSNQTALKYLQLDDLRRVMERVAYWIHTHGSTGDAEGGTLIDRDELLRNLCQEIKALKQLQLYEAKEESKRFVEFIRSRTGLLNEQGQDCYAFVHKTFQEYLCAQEILYQAENEGEFEIVLRHIREHLHDSHWREVLLLLVAQQKPKPAAKAIRTILQNNSEHEQWLHRDLLFAGSCLAELKGLRAADDALVQEILTRLVDLEAQEEERVGGRVRDLVFRVLCSFYESDCEAIVLQRLKDQDEAIDYWRLLKYRSALGEQDEVIAELLDRLTDDKASVRWRAADALGKLGTASEVIVQALLNRLTGDEALVRSSAANALGNLRTASEVIVQALLNRLTDDEASVRWRAADALGKLGTASEVVVQALLNRLTDDDNLVRWKAADALGNLGTASEVVVQALLNRLTDDDNMVRWSAADALGKLGTASEVVVQALLNRLTGDEASVRWKAADALGNLGTASEVVVQALLNRLTDNDDLVRWSAANALGKLGTASEVVVQALLNRLTGDEASVRWSAANALGKLGTASEVVVQALLNRLTDDHNLVRWRAADALGNLGKKADWVLPMLMQWIEQHQDSEFVGAGIDALGEMLEG
ncbi:HEAT repeat domain-containing protein [Leptolyngbya sp. FACHB-36]|uniref:NACHT domain-containing protein n=1 Tax=Leptolyngbya sp. FACHB-36 TaxID=2692808 RepID=UPI0016803F3E|nr:HEAT repeat domain-containing protein [Leptolyngbya sp. FACHB-36]MBD2020668.1 HEAT repeat domain-containing protein [Leptolyngbya sp. FACHB-36]